MSEIFKAFRENEGAIRRYIARFRSHAEDVEDFTQETFIKGYAAELKGEVKEPKAYLFTIARNVALEDMRKKARQGTGFTDCVEAAEVVDERDVGAEAWLDSRRKLAAFAKAVASLPPQCQKAFLMRRVEGLQYKQIANRMNISVSAVEKHVVLGLVKCRAYLKEHGYAADELAMGTVKDMPVKAIKETTVKRDD